MQDEAVPWCVCLRRRLPESLRRCVSIGRKFLSDTVLILQYSTSIGTGTVELYEVPGPVPVPLPTHTRDLRETRFVFLLFFSKAARRPAQVPHSVPRGHTQARDSKAYS